MPQRSLCWIVVVVRSPWGELLIGIACDREHESLQVCKHRHAVSAGIVGGQNERVEWQVRPSTEKCLEVAWPRCCFAKGVEDYGQYWATQTQVCHLCSKRAHRCRSNFCYTRDTLNLPWILRSALEAIGPSPGSPTSVWTVSVAASAVVVPQSNGMQVGQVGERFYEHVACCARLK